MSYFRYEQRCNVCFKEWTSTGGMIGTQSMDTHCSACPYCHLPMVENVPAEPLHQPKKHLKVEAKAFVTECRYATAWNQPPLTLYQLDIVMEVAATQAAISGKVPLLVVSGTELELALKAALYDRTLVKVTVEVG